MLKTLTITIQCLHKLLHQAKFYVEWEKNYLFSAYYGVVHNVWHASFQSFTDRPLLLGLVFLSISAVPHAKMTGILCKNSLLAKKFLITYKGTKLRSIEDTSLDFVKRQFRKSRNYMLKTLTITIQCLHKLLHQAKFYVEWEKNYLFSAYYGVVHNVWHASFQSFTDRPLLLGLVFLSISAVPHAKMTGILCKNSLLAKEKADHFKIYAKNPVVLMIFE